MANTKPHIISFLFFLCFFLYCTTSIADEERVFKSKVEQFNYLLKKGNDIYSTKKGNDAISQSFIQFDSAAVIARQIGDSLLIAKSIFAKGRVYDAWNKEPEQTIWHFKKAADLYQAYDTSYYNYMYIKHLVAHSYDKINDSTNCVLVLKEMYDEIITLPDSIKNILSFIPEMALISTEIGNYTLAIKILELVQEENIKNDPNTYNYKDHYWLTQSRLDIYYNKNLKSPFLDSLEVVYSNSKNIIDSIYYSHQLSQLYNYNVNYKKAFSHLQENKALLEKINQQNDVNAIKNKTLKKEIANLKSETAYQKKLKNSRLYTILILIPLLGIILYFTITFNKQRIKYRDISEKLSSSNQQLDTKIKQNDVLNKEIHHRIKNNLEVISSLLHMQERNTNNYETADNLKKARVRIESIATLHEKLIHDTHSVAMDEHLLEVIDTIIRLYHENKEVNINLNIPSVELSVNTSFSLSLIINEWFTNSLKYAKTDDEPVTIHLDIHINEENGSILNVEYKDNGKKYNNTKTNKKGLGTKIIKLLIKQLNAERLSTKCPFHYKLEIPITHDKK